MVLKNSVTQVTLQNFATILIKDDTIDEVES